MDLLTAHRLTRHQHGETLFAPLDLHLREGTRLGLAGPNGTGKSTLLRLLAGSLAPDEGSVLRPPGVRVALLPQGPAVPRPGSVWTVAGTGLQAVREAEARLRHEERRLAAGEDRSDALAEALATFERLGGYRAESELRETLAAVGFAGERLRLPAERLSEGERRRLALAAVLAGAPEVLLLDEPTNHLDLPMRAWLAQRLARWPGALVVVSHDRALLDRATRATLFLGRTRSELRPGGYTRARADRQRDLVALRRRDAERAREAARLREMALRLRARGDRSATARRRTAERSAARLGPPPAASPEGGVAFRLPGRELHGALLEGRALRREGVLEVPLVRLDAGRRVALLGANGSGKSTLLALLAGELASDDPAAELRYAPGLRLALVRQLDRGLEPGRSVVEQVAERAGPGRARRLLAEAGITADRWQEPPEALSGGERARAGLAWLEAREADLVLLDEPTNDLDLEAVEALEAALRRSPAGLLVATHDRRLAERVADEVWRLEGGRLRRYADVAAASGERVASPAGHGSTATPVGARGTGELEPETAVGDSAGGAGPAGTAAPTSTPTTRATPTSATPPAPVGARRRTDDAIERLEDECRRIDELLADTVRLPAREADRLRKRRSELDERLAAAYDAVLAPPAPRFRAREAGLEAVADRWGEGLLVMLVPGGQAAWAMDRLLRAQQGDDGAARDAEGMPWPWAHVRTAGAVAHVALVEPARLGLLPWARTALVEAATRFAFTLLPVSALQLFTRDPLPGTRLEPSGEGWWSWTLTAFTRAEGLPPPPRSRPRRGARSRAR